jgi:hypothetical protein
VGTAQFILVHWSFISMRYSTLSSSTDGTPSLHGNIQITSIGKDDLNPYHSLGDQETSAGPSVVGRTEYFDLAAQEQEVEQGKVIDGLSFV